MRTFLDDRFAPITSSVGYLRSEIDETAAALVKWRRALGAQVSVEEQATTFPECLHSLEPLVGGARPRELLVEMRGGWTAYFDCSLRGTDAVSTIGYLTQSTAKDGLAIRIEGGSTGQRHTALQFELFAPTKTGFLNYLRTVSLTREGSVWEFEAYGPAQPFEDESTYKQPQPRMRFSVDMLERYCRALGVDALNPDAYGPRSVLVRTEVPDPRGGKVMSLAEAQAWLGVQKTVRN